MDRKKENKLIALCIRLSIIVIALVGLALCIFWYPFRISFTAVGAPSGERVDPTGAQLVEYWVQLIFFWLASLPCFVILVYGWLISGNVRRDRVFTSDTAGKLKTASKILFIDSLIYLAAQLVFTLLRWNPLAPILAVVCVIGLILSFVLFLAGRYVGEAAKIKEENEGSI